MSAQENDAPQPVAARETAILETMVHLANTLVGDYDQIEAMRELVDTCARILDADAAGISLGRDDANLGFLVASDEAMETVELFQSERDEGPCVDAYVGGRHVATADVLADSDRWPTWSPRAHELGFRSADAFPLRLRDRRIGALNVYARHHRSLPAQDVTVGSAFADVATIAIVHKRAADDLEAVRDQLQHALDSRVVIEQAKGVLAERLHISPAEGFEQLRSHSRTNGMKLHEVAQRFVDGDLDLPGGDPPD